MRAPFPTAAMLAVYAALGVAGIAASQVALGANACHSGHKGCGGGRRTTTARTTATVPTTTSPSTTTLATTTVPTTTAVSPTTTAPVTTTAPSGRHALPYRYAYDTGSDTPTAVADGWNLVDAGGKSEADSSPAGTRALVWEGSYSSSTCSFAVSDATLRNDVTRMKGDPKVFGYYISDEPNDATGCSNAPAQHAARTALIHSIDPAATVVIVLDATGEHETARFSQWSTPRDADVIGIDPYPFLTGKSPDWALVNEAVAAADAAHFNYWFVAQSFANSEYRFPTAPELQTLLGMAASSHARGLMTFAWRYDGYCLCDHPDLLSVWSAYNHS